MDLQKFIEETIKAITKASTKLNEELETEGLLVNPPAGTIIDDNGKYDPNDSSYNRRYVERIEFDVAVTATSETGGEAGGGLKVWSVELGAKGQHSSGSESVSRVKFSIPVALPETTEHDRQRTNYAAKQEKAVKRRNSNVV